MTTIEEAWHKLEGDLARSAEGALLLRRVVPDAKTDIFIGVELETCARFLLVRILTSAVKRYRDVPDSRGLEHFSRVLAGDEETDHVAIGVRLKDSAYEDVFLALALDVIEALTPLKSDSTVAETMALRLRRWHRFFEVQAVQFGELWFFKQNLLPLLGASAVGTWTGPHGDTNDFRLGDNAVEVKTSCGENSETIRISSEHQLDDVGLSSLHLHHVVLTRSTSDVSLPDLIQQLREALAHVPDRLHQFSELLLDVGYVDSQASKYADTGYVLKSATTFVVSEDFPRLAPRDLPTALPRVAYDLSVSALASHALTAADFAARLSSFA